MLQPQVGTLGLSGTFGSASSQQSKTSTLGLSMTTNQNQQHQQGNPQQPGQQGGAGNQQGQGQQGGAGNSQTNNTQMNYQKIYNINVSMSSVNVGAGPQGSPTEQQGGSSSSTSGVNPN